MIPNFKKNRNNAVKRFLFIACGILMLLIFVFLIIADIKIYKKREQFVSQIEKLENRIQDLKNKNDNLKKGILAANDDAYIEKVAREELSLQKPGEKVVSFIKEPNQLGVNNQEKKTFLQIWLGWVGGLFKN